MSTTIDFRSDTVTKPSETMLQAMIKAELGDDVYGEDPTVRALEEKLAQMTGMEAGLFVSSGTQSNLLALLSHCQRGDEYLTFDEAHVYKWETGGACALGGLFPKLMAVDHSGCPNLDTVAQTINPDDVHFPRTRLLCLENTHMGTAMPLAFFQKLLAFRTQHPSIGLHLDGARLMNASIALQTPIIQFTRPFNSVSICLSKGLGAPVGSVLCGSKNFIAQAKRWRKMVGGGMRQAGVLAAAGLYALEHNVERLALDHENAAFLADSLVQVPGLEVFNSPTPTNQVYLRPVRSAASTGQPQICIPTLVKAVAEQGVLISGKDTIRLVTHMDITRDDCKRAVEIIAKTVLA